MSLKIRLARGGSKKRPYYSVVVADVRAPRDGRFIEKLGAYNPLLAKDHEKRFYVDAERTKHWLSVGAQPSDRVARYLTNVGLADWKAGNNPNKAKPGKKAQERVEEQAGKIEARKEREAAAKAEAKEAEAAAKEAEKVAAEEAKKAAEEAKNAPAEEAPAEAAFAFSDKVDDIVLLDGVGDATADKLREAGITKLTQIAEMSDEDLAALSEKVGAGDKYKSQEWQEQAKEMIAGKEPRADVDKKLAAKMIAG